MKFRVSRTSLYNQSIPPCDGAVCLTPNPTQYDGVWEIEIASLDELWEFIDKHGDIILSRQDPVWCERNGARYLEIYDDHRE